MGQSKAKSKENNMHILASAHEVASIPAAGGGIVLIIIIVIAIWLFTSKNRWNIGRQKKGK
jgi:hypothetical protein